jgi:hypothetical protein
MRKAAVVVLKRDGWWIPFCVLLVAISEYWREGRMTVGGLCVAGLISAAVLLITKVPDEIRKLEATREPL